MANTKVTGDLLADGTLFARHLNESHGITTSVIGEGTNLFYTDTRVGSYLGTYLPANGYDTATNIIASIVDSAPVTLDTLNELAAALGDDPNFATTVTNSLAGKLPLTGGTLTGALSGTSANFNSSLEIRTSTYNRISTYFSGDYTSGFKFSDLNGGIYYDAAADYLNVFTDYVNGKIAFSTAGSERVRITNIGNVGIGTTSPSSPFTVATDVRAATLNATDLRPQSQLNLLGGGGDSLFIGQLTNSTVYIQSSYYNSTLATYSISINPLGGNVGIGTISPGQKLHVTGNIYATGYVQGGIATASAYGGYAMFGSNSATTPLAFGLDGNQYNMVINTSGYVGVGTTNPSAKLHVSGNSIIDGNLTVSTNQSTVASFNGEVGFDGSTRVYITNSAYVYGRTNLVLTGRLDNSNDAFSFGTNNRNGITFTTNVDGAQGVSGTEKFSMQLEGNSGTMYFQTKTLSDAGGIGFAFTQGGSLGIGTTSPANKLTVEGTGAATLFNVRNTTAGQYSEMKLQAYDSSYFIFKSSSGYSGYGGASYVNYYNQGGGHAFHTNAGSNLLYITNAGSVGIGTTSLQAKLDVAGVIRSRGTNNHESIITKEGSTGSFTFSASELNGGSMDNVNYFIFVSVYNPTTDILLDTASLIIHGVMPRGGASTFSTISTLKAGGISTLTATNNSNDLVITTDSGTNFRCSVKVIAIGGTS